MKNALKHAFFSRGRGAACFLRARHRPACGCALPSWLQVAVFTCCFARCTGTAYVLGFGISISGARGRVAPRNSFGLWLLVTSIRGDGLKASPLFLALYKRGFLSDT
jgi:hypothetical protein